MRSSTRIACLKSHFLAHTGGMGTLNDTYLRADQFRCRDHDNIDTKRQVRRQAIDFTRGNIEQQLVPVHECEAPMHRKPQPRTLAQLDLELVAGSSTFLSRASLSTLPKDDHAVALKNRFSVTGNEAAEYPDTIDDDYSDFGEAYGTYRR